MNTFLAVQVIQVINCRQQTGPPIGCRAYQRQDRRHCRYTNLALTVQAAWQCLLPASQSVRISDRLLLSVGPSAVKAHATEAPLLALRLPIPRPEWLLIMVRSF